MYSHGLAEVWDATLHHNTYEKKKQIIERKKKKRQTKYRLKILPPSPHTPLSYLFFKILKFNIVFF